MNDIIHIFVLATAGAILAMVISEFAKNDPNAEGGVFDRFRRTWAWALNNALGGD